MIQNNMVQSGIPVIDPIAFGSHFCSFFETLNDLKNILSTFLKAGLENNEVCILFTSDVFTTDEAYHFFSAEIPNFETLYSQQQISFVNQKDGMSNIGHDQMDFVIESWFELEKKILSEDIVA